MTSGTPKQFNPLHTVKVQAISANDAFITDAYKADADGKLPRVHSEMVTPKKPFVVVYIEADHNTVITYAVYTSKRTIRDKPVIGRRVQLRYTFDMYDEYGLSHVLEDVEGSWVYDDSQALFYEMPEDFSGTFWEGLYNTDFGRERWQTLLTEHEASSADGWHFHEAIRKMSYKRSMEYILAMTYFDGGEALAFRKNIELQYGKLPEPIDN